MSKSKGIVPADGNTNQNTGLGNVGQPRRLPTTLELEGWIAQKINTKLGADQSFTAFELTREMRADHLDVEIEHDLVRSMVVTAAQNLGLDVDWLDYGGEMARTYSLPYNPGNLIPQANPNVIDVTPTPTPTQSANASSGQPKLLLPGIEEV